MLLTNGPESAPVTVVLAHGAGAPMDTPFMDAIAQGLADKGLRVVRFEFDYMKKRREDEKRRPPDRAEKLLARYREVVEEVGPASKLVIGGKSMGGRMATLVADELGVRGVVCLGYPFHPPGKPERLRTAHLEAIRTPVLIVQGTRDAFGTEEEVASYALASTIELVWMPDGDHSLKPRKKSGHSHEENLTRAVEAISSFVDRLS